MLFRAPSLPFISSRVSLLGFDGCQPADDHLSLPPSPPLASCPTQTRQAVRRRTRARRGTALPAPSSTTRPSTAVNSANSHDTSEPYQATHTHAATERHVPYHSLLSCALIGSLPLRNAVCCRLDWLLFTVFSSSPPPLLFCICCCCF